MKIKNMIKKIPPVGLVSGFLYWQKHYRKLFLNFPPGHYYSPLPDIEWVNAHRDKLYPQKINPGGIDFRTDVQKNLLSELSKYFTEFNFPGEPTQGFRYYCNNTMFGKGGALCLFGIIRRFKPSRIIEIGSGHSSALMLDINDRFMDRKINFSFIEPYPERLYKLLTESDRSCCTIFEKDAQEVPVSFFEQLGQNDILFIDSSHVSKIGSDVNYIFFEILPALKPGVIIHFHDICWPFEYPLEWINDARAWNEVYLLRAFLQYNNQFDILLFNSYLYSYFPDFYKKAADSDGGGSSLWIEKRS
ncbi:MAG: class I SAM-dependent methyltransferase [Planctomycetales bacterium]|nr:class I SAM-dependent methyltransferase [Planctomycetales bacterium]